MSIGELNSDDNDLLAAEYVLGVLTLAERLAVEERLKLDGRLRANVDLWTQRLAELNEDYAPVDAPDLLPKIERRLFPETKNYRSWLNWLFPAVAVSSLASLVVVALFTFDTFGPSPVVVTLAAEGAATRFEASIIDSSLTVVRVDGASAAADGVFELWAIEAGQNPRSLGTFRDEVLTVSFEPSSGEVTLAVSLEPTGGSPTGLPTGPVLAAGTVPRR